MSQKPPCGPNPGNEQNEARQHVEDLYHLTQQILVQSTDPHLPELGQLILRRGQMVEDLRTLDFDACPKDEQSELLAMLIECKRMDQTIDQNMQSFRSSLDEQIRGLKDAKALLHKYQLPDQGELGTRSRNA